MTWTPARITGAKFQAIICPGICAPLTETLPINLPLNFDSLTAMEIFRGVYTPANDYQYLFQNRPLALAPNFLMLLCGAHLNLTRVFSVSGGHPNTYARFTLDTWVLDPLDYLNSLYLEGRTTAVTPMAQGVAVDYTVIIGQAVIS